MHVLGIFSLALLDQAIRERQEAFRAPPTPPTVLLSVQTENDTETEIIEEIPAKEPHLSAMPKKSALKKKGSTSTPKVTSFSTVSFVTSSPLSMPLTSLNRPVTT